MLHLANPWGLLALAAIPTLVGLHFFRRRFRARPMAGLFLWPPPSDSPPAGRRLSRLETPVTLLLEFLAVLALSALVAGARWERKRLLPHRVVILDHSASMAARAPNGERFADRARRAVELICRQAGPPGEVCLSVVLSGPRPTVVVGPAAPADRGIEELRTWNPVLPEHSLAPALEVAGRLADAREAIAVVTARPGRAAAQLGSGITILGVGEPVANVAITAAERFPGRSPASSKVFARVANFSTGPAVRTLTLSTERGRILARQELRLAGGGEEDGAWDLETDEPIVLLELEGSDALALDDRAILARPEPRTVRVRCELPAPSAVRERTERALRAVAGVAVVSGDEDAPHLLVGLTAGPAGRAGSPDAWRFGIGAIPEELRGGEMLEPLVGPYLADPSHPLTTELDFRGVIWGGAFPVKPEAPIVPLAMAGDVPLLFQWRTEGAPTYVLNIDPERSNLHKAPAWPILFHNLAALRREALPGLARRNYRQGEVVSYRPVGAASARPPEIRILGPDDREVPAVWAGDAVEILDAWKPGVYRIREGGSPAVESLFSVLYLSAGESDLRGCSDASTPGPRAQAREIGQAMAAPWLEPGLCLLALLLLLLELAFLRRVRRVRAA